eukprot:7217982-Heterocapsa_arctica.AAC.1
MKKLKNIKRKQENRRITNKLKGTWTRKMRRIIQESAAKRKLSLKLKKYTRQNGTKDTNKKRRLISKE